MDVSYYGGTPNHPLVMDHVNIEIPWERGVKAMEFSNGDFPHPTYPTSKFRQLAPVAHRQVRPENFGQLVHLSGRALRPEASIQEPRVWPWRQ